MQPKKTNVKNMSEQWIKVCESRLVQLRSAKGKRDRLDLVIAIVKELYLLHQSLDGWARWMRNTVMTTQFSGDELGAIESKMRSFVIDFLEYDLEATKKWSHKIPEPKQRRKKNENDHFYALR
jgi:hypothetical protein